MKRIALVLTLTLIVGSVTGILLEYGFPENIHLHRFFARYFPLSSRRILNHADALRQKGTPKDLEESISLYREALSRDPINPYRWCSLGRALLDSHRIDEARRCYERAAELGPNNIQTLSQIVDFYKNIGQPRDAMRYASRMLAKYPGAIEPIFFIYLRPPFEFSETLKYGIPADTTLAQAYMRYLFKNGVAVNVDQCWNWVVSQSHADHKLAGEYASYLIRIGNPAKARDTWISWLGSRELENLIFNGGFESDPLPSPFDWRISERQYAEVSRDAAVRQEGKFSLRISFDGKENPVYRQISQNLFLDPGTYRLSGFIRTQEITTEQGIGIRIGSAATEPIRGTTDWKELSQTFRVPAPTLVRVEVYRNSSRKFANKLSGTAWLDDIQVRRVVQP